MVNVFSRTRIKNKEQENQTVLRIRLVSLDMEKRECCILNCSNKKRPVDKDFHYFGIPKTLDIKQKWADWISLQNGGSGDDWLGNFNRKKYFICSDHFSPNEKGLRNLKPRAVPSISMPITEANAANLYDEYSIVIEITMSQAVPAQQAVEESMPQPSKENLFPNHCATEDSFLLPQQIAEDHPQTKSKTAGKKRKCAANCSSPTEILFSFPSCFNNKSLNIQNFERCRKWVQNTGNHQLLNSYADQVPKKIYLCSNHFETSNFYNHHRKTLLSNAIPTIFVGEPISDAEMSEKFKCLSSVYAANSESNFGISDVVESNGESSTFTQNENQDIMESSSAEYVPDHLQKKFEDHLHSLEWRTCPQCMEKFFVPKTCNKKCLHRKNICGNYTAGNNMDPGKVPDALKELTYLEEQLIALVHPIVTVFRLKGHQFGYSGNVLNFPQDTKEFSKQLPHRVTDLTSTITVRTSDGLKPKDFQVRCRKVKEAVQWLIEHNEYYSGVEMSKENLNNLPADGNLYDTVICVEDNRGCSETDKSSERKESSKTSTEEPPTSMFENNENETSDGEYDVESVPTVVESTIPMLGIPTESAQLETVLEWPKIGKEPINEFTTVGYIARAFPCLFPYGRADLKSPREVKVSPSNYFKHLMRYEDGRFASHPRFRYFALNSLMRWQALTDGSVYVSANSEYKDMTVSELKKEIKKNKNIFKKIMFYSSNLRGTKSYWYARGKELLAMIEQLGLPTLFFTLSAADFHWPDLFKILAPAKDPDQLTEQERRKLIEENPMIVDSFFFERAEYFVKNVLKENFNVKDYWFRVEYQHRGSPHVHGVLWLENAPDVTNLKNANVEEKQVIADYFNDLISTMHPDVNEPKGPVHPSRLKVSDISDGKKDLAQLLNRVQRHTRCTEGYCLRKNKKTGKTECRFKFPYQTTEETVVVLSSDTGKIELSTARNDPRLNKYNAYIIQTWRANIDISPVLSKQALITYLAKYISKPEKESKTMDDLLKIVMDKIDESKTVKSLLQRLYIQTCSERDYSAQETCHLLMGLKLVSTSGRNFVTLNFSSYKKWMQVSESKKSKTKSIFEKYMERDEAHEDECLWHMACNINMSLGARYRRAAIVQVYPKLKLSSGQDNEEFYKQQVLLYVPWRSENQFMTAKDNDGIHDQFMMDSNNNIDDESTSFSWKSVYDSNININKNRQQMCDFTDTTAESNDYELGEGYDDYYLPEDWMCIAKMGPNQNCAEVELGRRDIDVNFDWNHALQTYEQYGGITGLQNFIPEQKLAQNQNNFPEEISFPNVIFTEEQESILKLVDLQIDSVKNQSSPNFQIPQTVIVQGRAGTGKSLVIQSLKYKISAAFGKQAFIVITPTGVSATAVGGSTIQSKLHINTKNKEFLPLKGAAAHKLQEELKETKFLIMDEFSMIGCQLMHMIEDRLRQAKGVSDNDFGNVFVYIFGDIKQLPPVGDVPVYSSNQKSSESIRGKLIYDNFHGAVVLNKILRQNNPNFQRLLNSVSEGNVSREDFNLLKTRFSSNLPKNQRDIFKNAIHLYPTRKQVNQHNKEKLINLQDPNGNAVPIARIPAMHNCKTAESGSRDDAEGLFPVLYFAEGVKVMLKSNLWTAMGLVNGAMGEVVHILYQPDANPLVDPPAVILCKFENYDRPTVANGLVPINPLTKSWTAKNGASCSRTQFPICLAYACSVHQSQGLTLDKAVINIGDKEQAPGITYVALSRVKSLDGILLESFSYHRLKVLNSKASIQKRNEWVENLMKKNIARAFVIS